MVVADLGQCAYEDCEHDAEFRCVVCRRYFCAYHIYQPKMSYICKYDFEEPEHGSYDKKIRKMRKGSLLRSAIRTILKLSLPISLH